MKLVAAVLICDTTGDGDDAGARRQWRWWSLDVPAIAADRRHFRRVTRDGIVVMGRRTWDALPRKPLPGRRNVVLTRRGTAADFPGADAVVRSVDELLTALPALVVRQTALNAGGGVAGDGWHTTIVENPRDVLAPVYVIGGGETYRALLPWCDEAYITLMTGPAPPVGGPSMPRLDLDPAWAFRAQSPLITTTTADGGASYRLRFTVWHRRHNNGCLSREG